MSSKAVLFVTILCIIILHLLYFVGLVGSLLFLILNCVILIAEIIALKYSKFD